MKPVDFAQANGTLTGGPAANFKTSEDVTDLPVYRKGLPDELPVTHDLDHDEVISCWRPSLRERIDIMFLGHVWLRVATSKTHPPVCLEGRNPFGAT
jgi:hypothetical protein